MSKRGYKIRNQEGIHFVTFAVVGWVDVFTRQQYRDVVVESLIYCKKNKGLRLHAWVIMSNHVHFIVSAKEFHSLSDILRDLKKYTSLKIISEIKSNVRESRKEWMLSIFKDRGKTNRRNSTYQFWRQDNKPIELTDNHMIDQRLNYLHNNPVESGIVSNPVDYLYSSARNYSDEYGLIEVELL